MQTSAVHQEEADFRLRIPAPMSRSARRMFPTPSSARRRAGFAFRNTAAGLPATIAAPKKGGPAFENIGADVLECGADGFKRNPRRRDAGVVDRATSLRAWRGRAPLPESEEPPEPRGHRRL
jgi:hypothetical protein